MLWPKLDSLLSYFCNPSAIQYYFQKLTKQTLWEDNASKHLISEQDRSPRSGVVGPKMAEISKIPTTTSLADQYFVPAQGYFSGICDR